MKNNWVWVDNYSKLDKAKKGIERSSTICVDTEYDSFRYFRDKLCLIQIKAANSTYLFDPLNTLDLSFLGSIFSNPDILKVVHAGDNDIRILKRDYGFEFKNIFDTHRAASILGCQYLSLESIIFQYLGVELNKTKKMQRSRWENRPLTDEQIIYAVRDTQYLTDLYVRLKDEIKQEGLERVASEAFDKMMAVEWHEKSLDFNGHLKIKGAKDLNRYQRSRLKTLYRWRFKKAKETNIARFMILSDQNILDLSKIEKCSVESLGTIPTLSSRKAKTLGQEIIEVLNRL
ncbi:MAG: ribonuclease D [Syntrophales bacterium]|nr:ribonuclease D [Syntrophales bacterium]